MTTAQSMTATALPGHRSPVDPDVRVVNASNEDLRAELDYRNAGTPQLVKATLLARAESYASDARKFADMIKLGQVVDSAEGEEYCNRFAAMFRAIAGELRKVAASL